MAHKGHVKLVDKYQFNEKKFITNEGVDEFQAVHVQSKNAYTLKRVGLNTGSERDQSGRILQELSVLKKLAHPLIPRCHKLLKTSNNMYLIFDRLAGSTLHLFLTNEIASNNWKNKLRDCFKIAQQLCELLTYLTDRRICHSYITAHNILIENHAISKLINFSLAVEFQNSESFLMYDNKNRIIDEYCAPEITNGKVTLKTDVYSAGVICEQIFIVLKEIVKSTVNPENEEAYIDKALAFVRTKMKNPELTLRATAKQAHIFFKQRQFEDVKEDVEDTNRNRLMLTDPGVRASHLDEDRMNKQRSQSPFSSALKLRKTQYSEVGSQTQEYFYVARKVLHKRNLSELLLELSDFCSSVALSSSKRSLPLSFLLIKKSTSIASQLAKFLETGRGDGLRMEEKIREKLKKHKLFANMEHTIHAEMKHLQEKLINSAQIMRETLLPLDGAQQLGKELETQGVDNDYFRKCVSDFQAELYHWSKSEESKVDKYMGLSQMLTKKQLALVFLLSLLADFRTIEQLFDELFSDNGRALWKDSFFVNLMEMEEGEIENLIFQQGTITCSKIEDAVSSSSHSISTSRRKL